MEQLRILRSLDPDIESELTKHLAPEKFRGD
jgi:hypothetical protein